MSSLHTRYRLTIEVLTPLHIGSGRELLRDYDYVVRNGRTWVINEEALLEDALSESGEFDNALLRQPAAALLGSQDFRPDSPFFRYVMPGEPVNRPLSEQIKDVWGNPYLPGSSVKGALRTMLMWGMYTSRKQQPSLQQLVEKPKDAAQALERSVFAPGAAERGEAPNKDFLRALQVADSTPVDPKVLAVQTARVYPTGRGAKGSGVDVDVEAVRRGTVFKVLITIDEYGFTNSRAAKQLGWDGLRKWLDRLMVIGQYHALQRVEEEKEFYRRKGGPAAAQNFYQQVSQLLREDEWLMQIGWGAGWNSKTLNNLLSGQPEFERGIVQRYRLDRGRRRQGEPFPSSRKLILHNGQPAVPMGWVKCRLEPAG